MTPLVVDPRPSDDRTQDKGLWAMMSTDKQSPQDHGLGEGGALAHGESQYGNP